MSSSLVKLKSAGIFRNNRWLVRNIDMELSRGEIITLIGPNGSGKSTTAKMALKILKPNEGNVWQAPNLRVGYVPQKLNFDRSMPMSVGRFMELTHKLKEEDANAALAEVGALHLRAAQVLNLSGGELQRVMLARAAATKPDVLVLDEPLQGVDFSGEAELYDLISQYRQRLNCGILLISHDLHVVMAASDRVICLNGHICCSGKPEEVAMSPEYNALFSRNGKNSAALYRHQHDHTHHPDGTICQGDQCHDNSKHNHLTKPDNKPQDNANV